MRSSLKQELLNDEIFVTLLEARVLTERRRKEYNLRKKKIVFVCWGNTCRSPMAQAIASKIYGERFIVESAGIEASTGLGATNEAIRVMAEVGIDISAHQVNRINNIEINDFDIIISMTHYIADDIRPKIDLKKNSLLTWNIIDPYGKGIEAYRSCVKALEKEIRKLI